MVMIVELFGHFNRSGEQGHKGIVHLITFVG